MAFDEAEYGEAVTGTERITVPAGSYTADTLTYTYRDPSTGTEYSYRWWVSEDVPGGLIRFEWVTPGAELSAKGEITQIDRRFTTDLLW